MKKLLLEIKEKCDRCTEKGRVAKYIPELAKADPSDFGICIYEGGGVYHFVGDYNKKFTAQSLIKPIILLAALIDRGIGQVEHIVGVEPTGKPFDAFNYSDRALKREHINPMINAGAIVLCSLIEGRDVDGKLERISSLLETITGNPCREIDDAVYLSEKKHGNKNRALFYMMKADEMIEGSSDETLDLYFKACALKVSCQDLAKIGLLLANHGLADSGQIFPREYAKYVNATMAICGLYDGAGEFALRVGIPAKSGVSGGIMAAVPGRMGIGIYSPPLDKKGNSLLGLKAIEMLSKRLDLSIY